MKGIITTLEAEEKYDIGARHLRYLLTKGLIKGRLAPVSKNASVWLIDDASLKKYSKKRYSPR